MSSKTSATCEVNLKSACGPRSAKTRSLPARCPIRTTPSAEGFVSAIENPLQEQHHRLLVRPSGEDRKQQQRDDVDDLDHRVDGGTGRVLVGVADRVAGHG